jgi:hypothetical protein
VQLVFKAPRAFKALWVLKVLKAVRAYKVLSARKAHRD